MVETVRNRYNRHGRFDRLRKSKRFLAWLAQENAALGTSATPDDVVATANVFASGILTLVANPLFSKGLLTLTANPTGAEFATQILTLTGQPLDTETVTLDAKVYTFQTALTDVDGNVLIGATASDSLDNLIAAITLGAGAGTTYAEEMTLHPTVAASAGAGDTMDVIANSIGTGGNSIASTETLTNGSFGAANLAGGVAGEVVVLGGTTYTFQDTLEDDVANGVLVGASASDTIDNLIAAINLGAGVGTKYSTPTVLNPDASGAVGAGDTMNAVAKVAGVVGDAIVTTETMVNGSWGAVTLEDGADSETVTIGSQVYTILPAIDDNSIPNKVLVGATASITLDNLISAINRTIGDGTLYSSATVIHPQVSAAAGAGDTMDVTATILGVAGNAVSTTETLGSGSFGAVTLENGVDGILTAVAHGISNAEGPYHFTTTDTLPAGLELATDYWVNLIGDDIFSVTRQRGGSPTLITDTGTGVHTITKASDNHDVYALLKTNKPETISAASDIDDLS